MTEETREEQGSTRDAARRSAINAHVGSRMRMLRRNAGMTSKDLAEVFGVTYQQALAYEAGHNKVSAGNLYLIAETLNVPVSFFFDELPNDLVVSDAVLKTINTISKDALNIFSILDIKAVEIEIRQLTNMYYLIDKPFVRKGIVEFMKVVGKEF